MLKFWAWIYRQTGWFSPWARLAEYKHLKTQWENIECRLGEGDEATLNSHVGIVIGCWQAAHGFTLTSEQVRKMFKKRMKRLKKGLRK